VLRGVLGSMLFFPSRELLGTPADTGLEYRDLGFETADGERLHGWWIAGREPRLGHILFCHGNAGNIGDRLLEASVLTGVGFDVLLFDYRGYGASTGRPDEDGTYLDARAALDVLISQPEADSERVVYLGESLGGAVALALALQSPPSGLILQSTFTSVRDVARRHYPIIPRGVIPDAYPSARRIGRLRAPVLVLHGDRDEIVPVEQGRALFDAAAQPKRLHVFHGAGHNDLVARWGAEYADVIAGWAGELVEHGSTEQDS
jgi:fermentation-respiration switch protein FrsA (DUF1100 family)